MDTYSRLRLTGTCPADLGSTDDPTALQRISAVICDPEAGVGAVVRAGHADLVLVVADPTAKSIEVARRAVETATREADVVIVANRVREAGDLQAIRAGIPDQELVAVPEEPAIARADRDGIAPIDAGPEAPGVRSLLALAERLSARGAGLRTPRSG